MPATPMRTPDAIPSGLSAAVQGTQGSSVTRNPGLEDASPVGLVQRAARRKPCHPTTAPMTFSNKLMRTPDRVLLEICAKGGDAGSGRAFCRPCRDSMIFLAGEPTAKTVGYFLSSLPRLIARVARGEGCERGSAPPAHPKCGTRHNASLPRASLVEVADQRRCIERTFLTVSIGHSRNTRPRPFRLFLNCAFAHV
jgi:hypothetical protein